MAQDTDNHSDIVWPDEENLFAADALLSEDGAVSQSSDTWTGSECDVKRETPGKDAAKFGEATGDVASTNEFWDHDDRNENAGSVRSVQPLLYPGSEEDADVWRHDKFDLLKIGPPPGLGGKQRPSLAQQGLHRRTQPYGPVRVLEVPRPPNTGQRPPEGWPDRSGYPFPMFSTADLNEDSKTPWPEESEVRDEDIDKWGWGDGETTIADNKDSAQTDAPAASAPAVATPPGMPTSTRSNRERTQMQQGSRLSQLEKQNLQQVNQRNAELAALMTRVRLEELRQRPAQISQRGAHQQPFGAPHSAANGSSGNSLQGQHHGAAVQYHFSNGVLVPSYAVQMPPALPSSPASMHPSLSHMFPHSVGQQARASFRPGAPAPQGQVVASLAQAQPSRPLDRTGAGYMAASRKGHQGYAPSSKEFPLKPGHLRAASTSMHSIHTAGPLAPPAVPFPFVRASLQPPVPSRQVSKPHVIGNPAQRTAAATSALALGSYSSAPAASQKSGKRALVIVDPESKQAVPVSSGAPTSQLTRTDSSSNSATHAEKPAKKLISIVDPNNKQPVQLPVKPLSSSRLIRTNSNNSAASSDSTGKRAIAIVDPHNKWPVALPASRFNQMQSASGMKHGEASQPANASGKRGKAPIAIVDPVTASEVQLPAVDIDYSKAGRVPLAEQHQGRTIRSRKPLAIVDPKLKAAASNPELQPQSANLASPSRATNVGLSISVKDVTYVRCQLQLCNEHTQQTTEAGDAVKVHLAVLTIDQVSCSISTLSQLCGTDRQLNQYQDAVYP